VQNLTDLFCKLCVLSVDTPFALISALDDSRLLKYVVVLKWIVDARGWVGDVGARAVSVRLRKYSSGHRLSLGDSWISATQIPPTCGGT
jgi:hypothetical protein